MRIVRLMAPLSVACALLLGTAHAEPSAKLDLGIGGKGAERALRYPDAPSLDLVEDHFGVKVRDPFRWLEKDVRADRAVRDWVAQENALTNDYLSQLPGRDQLRARMAKLYDFGRFSTPRKAGSRYFYTYNSGLQSQSPLYVREGLSGVQRMLLDPATLGGDGALALAEWEPSPDGRMLLYAVQDSGSDWRTLRILDVDSGRILDDQVEWVKFSGLSWSRDNRGFFYSRYDAPTRGGERDVSVGQKVYYHRVGTLQADDRLIYQTADRPGLNHRARVTDDGRWLVITSARGTEDRQEISVLPLDGGMDRTKLRVRPMVRGLDNSWRMIGSAADRLWFVTDNGAQNSRIVTLDARRPGMPPVQVVSERQQELLGGSMVGTRIVLAYQDGSGTVAELVERDGRRVGDVPLPGPGTAAGFAGRADDPETFFSFSGYTTPPSIYRYDTATGQTALFARPRLAFNPEDFLTEQVYFPSKDGTRIPMYLIRRMDVVKAGKAVPTLLYGYGGFNISLTPGFSPTRLSWLEQGGAIAIANLRGGGEFGRAWHDAGRLENKQNVFDDFIAAAEFLRANGYTGPGQLAIEGRSNGGLLVGAVVNQRPDLFAAALPVVGVMDMVRFDRFTAGRYWVNDYGDPGREEDFRLLYGYSPYHNVVPGRDYPAILVTTGDSDDRVVPAHSFKYAAALQASAIGDKPHLIRVEGQSGHGSGKPVDKIIDEYADMYAFAAHWTGLHIGEIK
jgi:prolyl oligopeptidase